MPATARRIEPGVGRSGDPGARAIKGTNGAAASATGSTRTYRALEGLIALRADPRRAIEEHGICCLICGQIFRQLTNTHLRAHSMGAVEYKRRFGYNRGRPLMCHVLQRMYAERAVKSGLAARIRCRPILVEPGLRRLGGSRAIALEELLTRREARRRPPARNEART
jgi:predicted transcriptional regulator